MKTITQYQCEICGIRYTNAADAEACEQQPMPFNPPIGMMFGDHRAGAFYEKITFAVSHVVPVAHGFNVYGWAARDNKYGDTYGSYGCCGSGGWGIFYPGKNHNALLNPNHPTFKRMVKYLQEAKVPITVWNGQTAVPLEKYVSGYKERKAK